MHSVLSIADICDSQALQELQTLDNMEAIFRLFAWKVTKEEVEKEEYEKETELFRALSTIEVKIMDVHNISGFNSHEYIPWGKNTKKPFQQ